MRWNYTKSGAAICVAGAIIGVLVDLAFGHEIGGPKSTLGRSIGVPLLALPVLAISDLVAAFRERRGSRRQPGTLPR